MGDDAGLSSERHIIRRILREGDREERRCYTAGSGNGGRGHKPRNVGVPW